MVLIIGDIILKLDVCVNFAASLVLIGSQGVADVLQLELIVRKVIFACQKPKARTLDAIVPLYSTPIQSH